MCLGRSLEYQQLVSINLDRKNTDMCRFVWRPEHLFILCGYLNMSTVNLELVKECEHTGLTFCSYLSPFSDQSD